MSSEVKITGPVIEEWINNTLRMDSEDKSLVPRKVRDISD